MGQIVAFDYGTKRIGIAATDDLQIIASGLTTVSPEEVVDFLNKYIKAHKVDRFVVGEPKQMNNQPSESEVFIQDFIKELEINFPDIPVERMDERFTSKMAFQTMIEGGLNKKKRKDKSLVDQISATIILQSYLDKKR